MVTATVWTSRRKWLGNLIPALVWFPPACAGLVLIAMKRDIVPLGVWLLAGATVFGWIALNQFGLFENARMKTQLQRILQAKGETLPADHWFVGFATPTFSSALDAHEDVGFLCLAPDKLIFVSETRSVEFQRDAVREIRFRANVHSMLGLGRWVSVEGLAGEQPIRLCVEPREKRTLLQNRKESGIVLCKLEEWRKAS